MSVPASDKIIPFVLNDVAYLEKYGNISQPLFLDTETCYLYKGIRLVQIFQRGWPSVLVFDVATMPFKLDFLLYKLSVYSVVIHNCVYDLTCFMFDTKRETTPFEKFDDTLLLARQAFPEKDSFSLDSCFSYVYGFDVYGQFGVDKKEMQKSFLSTKRRDGMAAELTEQQIQYACADVYYFPKLWDVLKEYRSLWIYRTDIEFIHNSLRWQWNGLPVDENKRLSKEIEVKKDIEEVTKKLPEGLNVNSFLQVRKFLGVEASAKKDLSMHAAQGDENAGLVLQKRKLLKLQNFLDRFNHKRVFGIVAPTAISGRVRCDGGDLVGADNILQVPSKLKGVFGFNGDDPRYLVYCDYAQLELRTACCLTGEKIMEKAFRENLDLHANTAAMMFENLSYEEAKNAKEERHGAKMCNFSLLYCGNHTSLRNTFVVNGGQAISKEVAQELWQKWKQKHTAFAKWHKEAEKKYRRNETLCTTKNGRKYKAKMFTDLCGIENQSYGADAAKTALNIFCKRFPNAKVLSMIHDAILLEAKDLDEAKILGKGLGEAMLEAWFITIKNLEIKDLPMPLEVCAGKNLETIESEIVVWETAGYPQKKEQPKLFEEKKIENEFIPPQELLHRDILFDADTIFYISALQHEDFGEALDSVLEYFKHIRQTFKAKSLKLFLTYGKNFRYSLFPQYKANRKRDAQPTHLNKLKEHCIKEFKNVVSHPNFEADDLIVSAKLENPGALVFAIDKDILNSLEGRHFNYRKNEIVETSRSKARMWPYLQAISGDTSDGIPGAPGLGEKKALEFLNAEMSESEMWEGVVKAFKSRGLTKEDALLSMRLVNMLQYKNGDLSLFSPKS